MKSHSIPLPGCRHDVLGHNLKAIGLLRALSTCAEPEHRDTEAEGWWDLDKGCFHLYSEKYPSADKLAQFFAEHYRPTPIFSPWNTGGGLDEKQETILRIDRSPIARFLWANRKTLRSHGFKANKPNKHRWKDGRLSFDLENGEFTLQIPKELEFRIEQAAGRRPRQRVVIRWARSITDAFAGFLAQNLAHLEQTASVPKPTRQKIESGTFSSEELRLTVKSLEAANRVVLPKGILRDVRTKTSGEKATLAVAQRRLASDVNVTAGIKAGRKYFPHFQEAATRERTRELVELFRDELPDIGSIAVDAVLTSRTSRASDNPLFLKRGEAGNSEIFRGFWSYFLAFKAKPDDLVRASLVRQPSSIWDKEKSPGTPFFPDAIKTYNNGLGWVVETFPFNAFDYLLAVEGALALRGAASRALAANSRRFAAFPFVFDSGEDLVDDSNEVKGTASSIWLPLWGRPATFTELSSFICDAQARLPGKDARFSADFARALRVQGVDAGFAGWQEFRFKMKASRVPWVCTGRYLGAASNPLSLWLNDALAPLDESGFLDQFEPSYKGGGKIDARSPHPIRASISAAIEDCVAEPSADNALEILLRLYSASSKLAQSKSFRETLRRRAALFGPLPQQPWTDLLQGLESPEFRIARGLASVAGFGKQADGSFSKVQPFLGSLLPVSLQYGDCRLDENSKQAVWSGTDLCHDLARVLARRYLDSVKDDRPALMSSHPARLEDVLAFLNGELDDHRIARWVEALSLIDWRWEKDESDGDSLMPESEKALDDEPGDSPAIPLAYAALRALLEVECEWQGSDSSTWKKHRSQRPVALLCQRAPSSLVLAIEDALRWLAIWGIPNCWVERARREAARLGGRDVVRVDHRELNFGGTQSTLAPRLAAAVLIPLDWHGRRALYRAVTIPQSDKH